LGGWGAPNGVGDPVAGFGNDAPGVDTWVDGHGDPTFGPDNQFIMPSLPTGLFLTDQSQPHNPFAAGPDTIQRSGDANSAGLYGLISPTGSGLIATVFKWSTRSNAFAFGTCCPSIAAGTNFPFDATPTTPFGLPQLTPNQWHHLFVSADLTAGFMDTSEPTIDSDGVFTWYTSPGQVILNPIYIFIDGANAVNYFTSPNATNGSPIAQPPGPANSGNDPVPNQMWKEPGLLAVETGFGDQFTTNPFGSASQGIFVGGNIALPGLYPPLSITTAFPSPKETGSIAKGYAYTQVWFNKFIDPTVPSNLAKFFTIQGNTIRPPNNVLAAQQTFGASDIFLSRQENGNQLSR